MGITRSCPNSPPAPPRRLPPEVVTRARFLVLDLVGNIVRARHDAESTPSFLGRGPRHGHGRRQFRRVRRRRALHARPAPRS